MRRGSLHAVRLGTLLVILASLSFHRMAGADEAPGVCWLCEDWGVRIPGVLD